MILCSEPYFDDSDIPDDYFEQELPVDRNIDSSPLLESTNSSLRLDGQDGLVQSQSNLDHFVIDIKNIF